jgi:hypothetical protein
VKNQILEDTSPTVFQIGQYRVTVESGTKTANGHCQTNTTPSKDRIEWRNPLRKLQPRSRAAGGSELFEPVPVVGGTYLGPAGDEFEIARVVGRDGSRWFAIDVDGFAVALKRVGTKWHALVHDHVTPAAGDLILHHGGISMVTAVLGEAVEGGWSVSNNLGNSLHVIHGEANHWMSLGTRRAPLRHQSSRHLAVA